MQKSVLNYLNQIVREKPDKMAYSDGTEGMTFREVYRYSRSIGSFLHEKGIYKKPIVVFMRKSPQEVTAFFGVIAGGCFYVTIDEEIPSGSIQLILDNVRSPLIICDEATADIAGKFQVEDCEIVLYDRMIQTPIDDGALDRIYRRAIDTDPIYIVFTSGSTGIPKGVAACHRSVIDYIEQLSEALHFN